MRLILKHTYHFSNVKEGASQPQSDQTSPVHPWEFQSGNAQKWRQKRKNSKLNSFVKGKKKGTL